MTQTTLAELGIPDIGFLTVCGVETSFLDLSNGRRYISLSDMMSGTDGGILLIESWFRDPDNFARLVQWELENNPDFNKLASDQYQQQSRVMTLAGWIELTGAASLLYRCEYPLSLFAEQQFAYEFAGIVGPEYQLILRGRLDESYASKKVDLFETYKTATETSLSLIRHKRAVLDSIEEGYARCPYSLHMLTPAISVPIMLMQDWFSTKENLLAIAELEEKYNPDFNLAAFDQCMQHSLDNGDAILNLLAVSNIAGVYVKSDSFWVRTIYANEPVARLYYRTVRKLAEMYTPPENDDVTL